MEFLRTQFSRIQAQLSGLSASQKMLAGTLVVIILMTLFWWTTFAGQSETVALLDQPMRSEEIALITARLEAKGVKYRMVGDRIHVPSERRLELWADLSYSGLMPRDTKVALDEIISKTSPFMSNRQQEQIWNQVRQTTLSQIVNELPDVATARVVIDDKRERGPRGYEPSAMVAITMRAGSPADNKLAKAAADVVSGSVANLNRSNVRVIINGKSFHLRNEDGLGGSDEWLDQVERSERYHEDKVRRAFQNIDGVVVLVTVSPNFEHVEKFTEDYDPKKVVTAPKSEETTNEENKSSQRSGGEAGMVVNGPMEAPAVGDDTSSVTDKSRIENVVGMGRTEIKSTKPGGELPPKSATVLIPRGYFVEDLRRRSGATDKDPDIKLVDSFITAETTRMRDWVRTSLGLATDDMIRVDACPDPILPVAMAPQAAATSMSLMLTDHAREIALGVLAVASLLLVSNMVRKASPAPAVATAAQPRPVPPLLSSDDTIGEVSEGKPLLDGMELDEESVKAQEMLGQVSQLVDDNPDAAANLVKRWLSRS